MIQARNGTQKEAAVICMQIKPTGQVSYSRFSELLLEQQPRRMNLKDRNIKNISPDKNILPDNQRPTEENHARESAYGKPDRTK
jgi:hypothetical protein